VVDFPPPVSEEEWARLRVVLEEMFSGTPFDAEGAAAACARAGIDSDVAVVMVELTRRDLVKRVQSTPPRWELP
jgi:hypothetical protein